MKTIHVLTLALSFGAFSAFSQEEDRATTAIDQAPMPNVLLILLDDLGYADLGCQGSPDIRTPHIDTLAAKGVRFTAGYIPVSVCGPSRASLLTGKYSAAFGLVGNSHAEIGIPHEHKTIAEYLKRADYATRLLGKWHLGRSDDQTPMARGFDDFLGLLGGSSHFFPFSESGQRWNEDRDKTPMQASRSFLEYYRIIDQDRSVSGGAKLGQS